MEDVTWNNVYSPFKKKNHFLNFKMYLLLSEKFEPIEI